MTASSLVDPVAQRRGVARAPGGHVVGRARDAGHRCSRFGAVAETGTPQPSRCGGPLGFVVGVHVVFLDLT